MTLRIYAELAEYDPDKSHTTTNEPEFLYASIFVTCSQCILCDQASSLTDAMNRAKRHAELMGHD